MGLFHKLDPTRPVTAACDNVYAEPRSAYPEFLAALDIVGYNYVDRWGARANQYYSIDRELYPQRKFIGTEDGALGGLRGSYGNPFAPIGQPASPPMAQPAGPGRGGRGGFGGALPRINVEALWKAVRTNDYVIGDFMWTGIDYLGESGVASTSGVLDTAGFPKDGFYFYQSQWTTKSMVHVFPHWNWKGHEGQILPVTCYTNCDTVELFVNGKSWGVKGYEFPRFGVSGSWNNAPPRARVPHTTGDLHLTWDVMYEPGTLRAVGTKDGQVVATEEVDTTGDPAAIKLSVDKRALTADGRDVAHVIVKIVDDKGRVVPTAINALTFDLQGAAQLIGVDNGNPTINESYKGNQRRAFNGLALAIVQATRSSGPIHLTVHGEGLPDASVDFLSK